MEEEILNDEFFMREALKEAVKALNAEEIPVGAVVTCNQTIVARGYNQVETLHDPTAHAEILAITSATNYVGNKFLSECTLYVTIEPCAMCDGALSWSQIGRLVYGAPDEKRGYHKFTPCLLHHGCRVTKGILEEEARKLMECFFNRLRQNKSFKESDNQ